MSRGIYEIGGYLGDRGAYRRLARDGRMEWVVRAYWLNMGDPIRSSARSSLPLLLSTLHLVVAGVWAGAADPGVSGSDRGEELLAAVEALRVESGIPGLSIAVVENGETVLVDGLGLADLEAETPATARTRYDIASVSKPISAVTVIQLVEQGLIDLDRPIGEYSEWEDFCAAFAEQPSIFARDLECEPAVHTLRHLLSHTATGSRPGDTFSYNPVLYSWASRPVMKRTGVPFSESVAALVFAPAGMSDSARRHRALALPAEVATDLAPPHRIDESGATVRAPELQAQGDGAAGGVVSSVLDLAGFDKALDDDLLISAESRAMMMSPTRSTDGTLLPYGVGWFVQEYGGHQLVWHSGWWEDAYSALYLKVPERNVTLILLANSEGLWWDNPLDEAKVEGSPFARAFLEIWLE